jgi:hypothetical protein
MILDAVIELFIMTDRSSSSDSESRVVRFPRSRVRAPMPAAVPSPVKDLAQFERGDAADDYRHRMIVNVIAFVFVLALIGVGYWLAETMAEMRKNQDCVLSDRRGCTPVEVNTRRW